MRVSKSWLWQFFTRSEEHKNRATCNICNRVYNCASVSNLKLHLQNKHPTDSNPDEQDPEYLTVNGVTTSDVSSTEVKQKKIDPRRGKLRSFVWKYMRIVKIRGNRTTVQCLVCRKTLHALNSTTTNLAKHLRSIHPADIDETRADTEIASSLLYDRSLRQSVCSNTQDSDDDQMSVQYLDETFEDNPIYVPDTSNKRPEVSSSAESLSTGQRFGRYVGALLDELPVSVAYKLQADFISRVVKHLAEGGVKEEWGNMVKDPTDSS